MYKYFKDLDKLIEKRRSSAQSDQGFQPCKIKI